MSLTRERLAIAALSLLAVLLYLGLSAASGGSGFPLDDSWIHQTYARNLAQSGRWEYVSGTISAGSTAPLWTVMLAIGYFLRLPYLPWTYLLGLLILVWTGWVGAALWRTWWPEMAGKGWLAGAALVVSWPLVWAAGSGMETLLFAALALQTLLLFGRQMIAAKWRLLPLGLLAGLLILVRPEGIGLALLMAAGLLSAGGAVRQRLSRVAAYLLAAFLPLLPYFALNLASGGNLWPNTFYAKQAEYAFLGAQPLPFRFAQLLYFGLGGAPEGWRGISGARLLLLPGLLISSWQALRGDWNDRRLLYSLPLLWAVGHVFVYAWRLPVTYQHGRYLMPVVPVYILFGLAGSLKLWRWLQERELLGQRTSFVLRGVAGLSFATLMFIFLLLGSQAYARDVAFINGEMVDVAHWLQDNTPQEALIAAHDIGAIGYFGTDRLLDLAGLITPQVIPLLADEQAVTQYVLEHRADFLVTAPGWPYHELTTTGDATLLYSTDYPWTREQGFNNMSVYRLSN